MLSEFEILYKIVRAAAEAAVHTFFGESKRSRAAGKKTKNKNKNLADRKLKFFVTYTKLTGDMARERDRHGRRD